MFIRGSWLAAVGLLAAGWVGAAGGAEPTVDPSVRVRGRLADCRARFEREKRGTVAFLGGSITEMNGYRPLVAEWLRARFPATEFNFVEAGIASTCSTTGAFRLERDVLAHGPIDLLLVEFAVNDDQDAAHAPRECRRGMEGIVRRLLAANPAAGVVMIHFTNEPMLATARRGEVHLSAAAHEEVAAHYDISTVNIPAALAARIDAGSFSWERYGGTHPGKEGNRLAAALVEQVFQLAWSLPLPVELPPPAALPRPLDSHSYDRGRFVEPAAARFNDDWTWSVPEWKTIPGSCRERFLQQKVLSAVKPGAELTFTFEGRAVGAHVLAGPDAGALEASVDGGPFHRVELYHRFSRGLHYPRTVMFAADLPPGEHTLVLRTSAEKPAESQGHAARILQFAVNE